MVDPSPTLSRRVLLAGAAGAVGVAVLAACSSSSGGEGDDGGGGNDAGGDDVPGTTGVGAVSDVNLLAIFPPQGLLVTGSEQRLPFTLADVEGAPLDEVPDRLEFVVQTADGDPVGDPVEVGRRNQGIPTPYFPLLFTFPEAGDYQVVTTIDGEDLEPRLFQVGEPDSVQVPQPGQPMIPVDTPTVEDPRNVDPICTADPDCDLHGATLTQALDAGTPLALMIATPEFCQTAICGPVLDVLLAQRDAFPSVTMVHAEVYKNPEAVDNVAEADLTPVIDAYRLSYEPVLYLANADGTIATRLDTIFDETEVAEALASLTA